MSPEFRSLLLKEWSERRRLFLFGVGLLCVYLGYLVAYEVEFRTRALVAAYYSTCLMFGSCGAVLLAMSVTTGEYSQRTLRFSASLPVPLRTVAWARLFGAWGCLAIPMLLGGLLVSVLLASGFIEQAGLRPADYRTGNAISLPMRDSMPTAAALGFLWSATAIAIVQTIYLATLIAVVGTWFRSEGAVGSFGAVIVLLSTISQSIRAMLASARLDGLGDWIGGVLPGSLATPWGYGEADGSSYSDLELAPLILGPVLLNLVITLGLGEWFARRYGSRRESVASAPARSTRRWWPRWSQLLSWFSLRWRGQLAALVWLAARQSAPLCLAGLAFAALITPLGMNESTEPATISARIMGELPSSTWFVGLLWAAIVAMSIFSSELKPGLEHFWRSRPIAPTAWFWTKFTVGLLVLLTTLDLVPLLISRSSGLQSSAHQLTMNGLAFVACIPMLHAMIYALAVAAICRIRRPIPAAITAVVSFGVLEQILESIPVYPRLSTMSVYNHLAFMEGDTGQLDLTTNGYPVVYGTVVLITVVATVLASRIVIPPVVASRCLATLLVVGLWVGQTAEGAEVAAAPTAAEIVAGIQQRELLLKNLHLRLADRVRKAAADPDAVAGSPSSPAADREESKRYEYYNRPPARSWMEIDDGGKPRSFATYDGTISRYYNPGQSSPGSSGTIMMEAQAPPPPFITPEVILANFQGHLLTDLVASAAPEAFTFREAAGEQLVDIVIPHPASGVNELGFQPSPDHRFEITLNLSRNYWPIRMQMETFDAPHGRVSLRLLVTTSGWIDAGPIVFPETLMVQSFLKPTDRPVDSNELVLQQTRLTTIELVEINPELADSVFVGTFPPQTVVYDLRERRYYQSDTVGELQPFTPQPKGVRGAVLVYHLLWISGLLVYLFRRPPAVA